MLCKKDPHGWHVECALLRPRGTAGPSSGWMDKSRLGFKPEPNTRARRLGGLPSMSLSGPQRQAEERLARPGHCPVLEKAGQGSRPPLHAWAPTLCTSQCEAQWPRAKGREGRSQLVASLRGGRVQGHQGYWLLGPAGTIAGSHWEGAEGWSPRPGRQTGHPHGPSTELVHWTAASPGPSPHFLPLWPGRLGVHSSQVPGHRGAARPPSSPPPGHFQARLWGDRLRTHSGSEVKVTDFPAPLKPHHTQDEGFRTRVKRSAW